MRLSANLFLILSSMLMLGACSDSSDSKPGDPLPVYDFSLVDARLQQFIEDSDPTEGISITIVDRVQGTVHEAAFGDHPENIVVLLASVSKFASVTLLMAIDEDDSIDFDIDAPIRDYLPWKGVYGEPTTAQLLSNTSGIPGGWARDIGLYGVHNCQYDPDFDFEECAKLIYATQLPAGNPPGTVFDYGGSQWHLAGAVAMQVTNSDWNQAFDKYVAGPCELDVYRYGNMEGRESEFTGHPDSLGGLGNPQPGWGGISSMQDMAKLLLLHIREGKCGDNEVLSQDAVMAMQVNRIEGLTNVLYPGRTYGMGWFGREDLPPTVFYDTGGYGSVAWLDTQRMVAGFIAIDDYSKATYSDSQDLTLYEIIPLVGQIVDEARMEVGQ
jgi:CubicO group peptidase (beta-lactamase class C family)